MYSFFFFSSRRRHTRCALVTGVQTCALPILLSNILRLRHLTAYDVMVPRADIVAVDLDTPLDELIDVMSGAGHSRLPVYRDTLDEVVGIVHIKDLLHDTRERKESGGFDLVDLEIGRAHV